MTNPRIGLALGGGSARGWAHIGVLRALERRGVRPDVIGGSSIGALVGGAYASGNLDTLENWARDLDFWDVVRLLDVRFDGGLIRGDSLIRSVRERLGDLSIEQLPFPFGAVATDLVGGREMWLQSGPLVSAIRASMALPGLLAPVREGNRWLADGGLVNPVPVSLCRALGAERIVAVNLNGDIVGRHLAARRARSEPAEAAEGPVFDQLLERLHNGLREQALSAWRRRREDPDDLPGLFEVMASAINIMQDRITRVRMADDPPDILVTPHLGHLGLLEFDRAAEAIRAGEEAVEAVRPQLETVLAG